MFYIKKSTIFVTFLVFCCLTFFKVSAQPTGYYNGTEGLSGESLKTVLHDIIDDHYFHENWYSDAKYTFLQSDADPNQAGNIIDVYSGNSMNGLTYGTQQGTLNREHVWAKSHGAFPENSPMYSDHHNLKPCEASINQDRSNLDFDWSSIPHPTATGSKYDSDSWEPRDAVKGDVARIIFYMATRYEGTNGELDLEVADWVNTYPMPKHGKLSTLFAWNISDPPDDFERNRNNVIYAEQGNRNPFIDHPDWVSMIWGTMPAPSVTIGNFSQNPNMPAADDAVEISCIVEGASDNVSVKIWWGNTYSALQHSVDMILDGTQWKGTIPPQTGEDAVFYQVQVVNNGETFSSVVYNYAFFNSISISEIQGTGSSSPYEGQIVSTIGVVTAVLSNGYYLQEGENLHCGIFVYDYQNHPTIGNKLFITGRVSEYHQLTELSNISEFTLLSPIAPIPDALAIPAAQLGEDYESMKISVQGICKENSGNGYWLLEDESGTIFIHNNDFYSINPVVGNSYSLTGILSVYDSRWFIELYSYSVNIQELAQIAEAINIFPNPTQDDFYISIPTTLELPQQIDVLDVYGKTLRSVSWEDTGSKFHVNIADLPSGLYLIRIYHNDYQFIKKIIKSK
ncbi:MAG: endonuclease [Bacteroidales bacterium]|nr:endonuclease [Bacteroidales bacterium]